MTKVVFLLVACAALVAAASAIGAATPTIRGAVGPGDTIRLTVKPKKAGLYRLTVQDSADEHNFRITHILETHNHADHVSGKGRLQKATGATIHVPAAADVAFEAEPLADGDSVTVGEVRIAALATPGHRPEHTAYVISDAARGEEPWLVVTGDSLFVGDVARPDLAVDYGTPTNRLTDLLV